MFHCCPPLVGTIELYRTFDPALLSPGGARGVEKAELNGSEQPEPHVARSSESSSSDCEGFSVAQGATCIENLRRPRTAKRIKR